MEKDWQIKWIRKAPDGSKKMCIELVEGDMQDVSDPYGLGTANFKKKRFVVQSVLEEKIVHVPKWMPFKTAALKLDELHTDGVEVSKRKQQLIGKFAPGLATAEMVTASGQPDVQALLEKINDMYA